jgi:hypothetical protein
MLPIQVKPLFKVSFGSCGFEHYTKDNLKWRKFNTVITALGSKELIVK